MWYAGYGSHLSPDRFGSYLLGGRPEGATRTYPGAREPVEPLDVRPVTLPGRLSFAWELPTWGGGIAFFSPSPAGAVRATAYLVTTRQFSDVFAQEMWASRGSTSTWPRCWPAGATVGPGRDETLHLAGTVDELPVLTFSCPDVAALGLRPPAAPYLATMASGLRATHELAADETVDYLLAADGLTLPGSNDAWTRQSLTTLVTSLHP